MNLLRGSKPWARSIGSMTFGNPRYALPVGTLDPRSSKGVTVRFTTEPGSLPGDGRSVMGSQIRERSDPRGYFTAFSPVSSRVTPYPHNACE